MFVRLRLPLLVATLLILVLAVATLANGQAAPLNPAYLDEPLSAPGQWFDSQRAIGGDRHAYARAVDAAAEAEVIPASWRHVGPTNIGGRVTDLVVDPTTADRIFIAAASGGVWESTDGAKTFKPAWPATMTQSVGALAVTPTGTLFAGTGESNPGGGSITYGGTGLYRSKDKGRTWQYVGLSTAGAFGRIVVDPADPKTIFAAASGNLFIPGGERGLYRSVDGGDSWTRVLDGDNGTTGAVDVAIDPGNPENILAAMWDHHRTPDHRIYAGSGSGVYRSADGGSSWSRVADVTLDDAADVGRIGVAFSPANPDRAYAVIANRLNGSYGAFFRSDNGGASWTKMAATGSIRGAQSSFGWWFARVFPDPNEVDRLFVPGVSMTVSTNGGQSFSTIGAVLHADQHAMVWDPANPSRVYVGNDGGVYRSDGDGAEGTWVPAALQAWTQHYSVDVGEISGVHISTGLQDNGCKRGFAPNVDAELNGISAVDAAWTELGLCGDGLATLINPADESITYSCSQYGGCGRQRAGALDPLFRVPSGRKGWFAPIEFDPTNPSVMYFGTEKVHRSTDGGNTWTDITGFNMADPDEVLDQTDPHNGYKIRGVVTAVGIGKDDPNTVYAGTDNGRLWVTRDLGANWTELPAQVPGGWITRVTVDPTDADTAYVAFSGYRGGSDNAHVFRTTDAGQTWTNLSGDLPVSPVNDVVMAGNGKLAAATDVGVFLSSADGVWKRLGNLPTVPVLDLRYHTASNRLTAATFGHGIQVVTVP